MLSLQADIMARLRSDILIRQGLQKTPGSAVVDMGLGNLNQAFPSGQFPLAAIHEFICTGSEQTTAAAGFIAALLSPLMRYGGICAWLSPHRQVFPPALTAFGIDPHRVLFIDLPKEKELLWCIEQALTCGALCAVVGEIPNLGFTASRRLQLAVEQSRVTGFLLRQTKHPGITACVSRWHITPAASHTRPGMPGVGFPRWNVELLKIRNGRPGRWQLEWKNRQLHETTETIATTLPAAERKIV